VQEITESEMCELWARLLGLPDIAPTDDFFENGGDSLLALELCQVTKSRAGVEVGLLDLFDHPTPRDLLESMRPSSKGKRTKW